MSERASMPVTESGRLQIQIKDSRASHRTESEQIAGSGFKFPNPPEFAGYTGYTGYTPLEPLDNCDFSRAEPVTGALSATGYTGYTVAAPAGSGRRVRSGSLDFGAINAAARHELPALLARWLPDGRVIGREYEARNPRRADRNPGSFRVNLRTGRWCDFATSDRGGDPVSLAAYLFNLSQVDAGRRLAAMLGVR